MKAKRAATGPVEGPWALPEGWRWERLGDVCEPSQYGWTTKATSAGNIKFLRTTDISSGHVNWATVPYCDEPPSDLDRYRVKAGDILISRAGSVGKSFLIDSADEAVFASYLIRYRPFSVPRYIHHWLQTDTYWSMITENTAGIAIPNVNASKLSDLPVPMAPEHLRETIVARIDELFAEVDDGEAALARARGDLATWRKALLKAAVTGDLTADWRAERLARDGPPAETGAALLARLLTTRRARWEAEPRNRGKRYVEPVALDGEAFPELPRGWVWSAMGQLLDRIEAGLNVKCVERPPQVGETGLLKISAVTWWRFNERASKTLAEDHVHSDEWLIEDGDLLVSRANTLELVGAPAIVEDLSLRLMLSDKVLRLAMPHALRRWVFYVMRSPFGRAWIESRSTGNQLSMRNISQDALRALPIPLPPPPELDHLVQLLDAASSRHEATAGELGDFVSVAATLRQSILAAAFRGELA